MLATYKAILKANRLQWREEEPEMLPPDQELAVIVTILDESTSSGASLGRLIAEKEPAVSAISYVAVRRRAGSCGLD